MIAHIKRKLIFNGKSLMDRFFRISWYLLFCGNSESISILNSSWYFSKIFFTVRIEYKSSKALTITGKRKVYYGKFVRATTVMFFNIIDWECRFLDIYILSFSGIELIMQYYLSRYFHVANIRREFFCNKNVFVSIRSLRNYIILYRRHICPFI